MDYRAKIRERIKELAASVSQNVKRLHWREAEADFRLNRDQTLPITLPKLKFMEDEPAS
jgi:hypothetical protein